MNPPVLSEAVYEQAAECLRALAHPKRLMLLRVISKRSASVGELAEAVDVASNVASQHLRLLERCGFVRARREAQVRYYEIVEPHVLELLKCVEVKFS